MTATTTMLCIRAAATTYCLPVSATRAVRSSSGMTALPAAKESVVGVLPDDPPLTVIGPFGTSGERVVIVDCEEGRFGLLVDEVIGLRAVEDATMAAAPAGQSRKVIAGSVQVADEVLFVIDTSVLAGAL